MFHAKFGVLKAVLMKI